MIKTTGKGYVKQSGLKPGVKERGRICLWSDALQTLETDKFLVGVVQVVDDFGNRFDKLQEIWDAVPRDPTKYYEKT